VAGGEKAPVSRIPARIGAGRMTSRRPAARILWTKPDAGPPDSEAHDERGPVVVLTAWRGKHDRASAPTGYLDARRSEERMEFD
jgi:hypothetical protein